MSGIGNELHAFLPRRQDELIHIISQLRERLSPKSQELAEVCELMSERGLKPFDERQVNLPAPKEPRSMSFCADDIGTSPTKQKPSWRPHAQRKGIGEVHAAMQKYALLAQCCDWMPFQRAE